jgi:hypothetical protein
VRCRCPARTESGPHTGLRRSPRHPSATGPPSIGPGVGSVGRSGFDTWRRLEGWMLGVAASVPPCSTTFRLSRVQLSGVMVHNPANEATTGDSSAGVPRPVLRASHRLDARAGSRFWPPAGRRRCCSPGPAWFGADAVGGCRSSKGRPDQRARLCPARVPTAAASADCGPAASATHLTRAEHGFAARQRANAIQSGTDQGVRICRGQSRYTLSRRSR